MRRVLVILTMTAFVVGLLAVNVASAFAQDVDAGTPDKSEGAADVKVTIGEATIEKPPPEVKVTIGEATILRPCDGPRGCAKGP